MRQFQIQRLKFTQLALPKHTTKFHALLTVFGQKKDCSIIPVVLNGFPLFPLNVPALIPDLLRENSCVVYSIGSIFEEVEEGKTTKKKKKKKEATRVH